MWEYSEEYYQSHKKNPKYRYRIKYGSIKNARIEKYSFY